MAFIEDALKQILSDDADVVALVGNRVKPGFLEQSSTYPAVSFRITDVDREPVLESRGTSPPMTRVVFFSVAKEVVNGVSPRRMVSLVDKAVRHALQGYSGTVNVSALSPDELVNVLGVFFVTASDTFDDLTKTYQAASVFDVWHSETIPD